MKHSPPEISKSSGFSLIELLVSMTILSAMLLMFVGMLDQTQNAWQNAQGRVSQFREARRAFDIVTKNLSQATLNPYYEAYDEGGDGVPDKYIIQSELHFTCLQADQLPVVDGERPGPGQALFFQAPLGVTYESDYATLNNLLNGRGYYVHFNSDEPFRPPFFEGSERMRYRLMEMVIPTEFNAVYADHADSLPSKDAPADEENIYFQDWWTDRVSYTDPTGEAITGNMLEVFGRPLAENIIALVVSPRVPVTDLKRDADERDAVLEVAPHYEYDSQSPEDKDMRHQLPPLVKVTMIAIDEVSATRLALRYGDDPYVDKLGIKSSWATRAVDYEDDLDDFVDAVRDEGRDGVRVQYKIFATTVSILASKYSRNPNPDE